MFYVFGVGLMVACLVVMRKASPPVWCALFLVLLVSELTMCGRLIIKPAIQNMVEKKFEKKLRATYGSDLYDSVMAEGVLAGEWDEEGNRR